MHFSTQLDVDVVAVETDDQVSVLVGFLAPDQPVDDGAAERAAHTVVVVLDRSGSMAGDRLDNAKRALLALVDRLADLDSFGLVAFDQEAQISIPLARIGMSGRDAVKRRIVSIRPGGSTDLSSGYLRGLQELRRVPSLTGSTLLLLSDGHANAGVTDPDQLSELARKAAGDRVCTSTVGIGLGYDETILAAMAVGGQGNHAFAEHAEGTVVAVAGEIDGLLSKTVQAASLTARPLDGVLSVTLRNDLPATATAGGIVIELGDFYAGEQRNLVLEFAVPACAALGVATVAELELRYVQLPELVEHVVTVPIGVNVVPGDVAAGRVADAQVTEEKLLLTVQQAKRRSEEALRRGDIEAARDELVSGSDLLECAPQTVSVATESDWFADTMQTLDARDEGYNLKRMRASSTRAARGYKSRWQGGETG